jgi:hypothetical protein
MGAAAPDPVMPLVLVSQTGRRREVTAVNAAAIEIGLRIGTAVSAARVA